MTERQTAADYEREAQRLAADAKDVGFYGTPATRDRMAVLSNTYATLALMATIRDGREATEEPEEAPDPELMTLVSPEGEVTLYPIPRGGSDAPLGPCIIREEHPAHLWFPRFSSAAKKCPGVSAVDDR